MKEVFDVKNARGKTIGSIEVREKGILQLSFSLILSLIVVVGLFSLIYFIWPLCYQVTVPYFEKGDQLIIIITYTVVGGIILGCLFSIVLTIKHRKANIGVSGKMGMGETMVEGIKTAAITSFCLSFGITAITAIIHDIVTGQFRLIGLLLLIPIAILIALLSILPVIVTGVVDVIIALVHDIVLSITEKIKRNAEKVA